jgi:hypothetical protein
MFRLKRTILVLIAVLVVLALVSPSSSVAQTVDFGSTPEAPVVDRESREPSPDAPRFGIVAVGDHPTGYFDDVEVEPGSSIQLTAAIINAGQAPVNLRTYKVNALSAVNGGFLSGAENDPPIGATAWIDYPAFDLQLQPGTQQEVTFTVTVPEGTAPGQYVSGLFARMTEAAPLPGSEVLTKTVSYVISVGILVPGDMEPAFALDDPDVEGGMLTIPVTNTGNYVVRPAGELTLANADGEVVHTSTIEMGSIYAGVESTLQVALPPQMAPGDYTVDLKLVDEASGASASLDDAVATVPDPGAEAGLSAVADIAPNADPIGYANVNITFRNGGMAIPAANVTLTVLRDGTVVEDFPLETALALPTGETKITARYIPVDDWVSGTYTFELEVRAISRQGGDDTIILTEEIDDEIVVP